MKKIAVIGVGNILLRDDGVGIHCVTALEKDFAVDEVEYIDAGTAIFDLLGVFETFKKIIIVDALKGGHEPGTIYKMSVKELGELHKNHASLHDVQIVDLLQDANRLGAFPDVTIIGIEPEEIFYDMKLSDLLQSRLPDLLSCIKAEIKEIAGL